MFRAFPENELYVKNEEGISNLKLSDRLPTDQAWLSGINDITKDGVYFTYQEKYIGEKRNLKEIFSCTTPILRKKICLGKQVK